MKAAVSAGDERPYGDWARMCRELNADERKARLFREQRYAFTHRLAERLLGNLPLKGRDQVIYAVHLVGHHPRPVYLGVSSEGRRRLWDLPVGESHHLSNTYPPEIWERVQVLHWREVLERKGHDLARIESLVSTRFDSSPGETLKLIGMGIEFLFQKTILPELNARTKLRIGGFREVRFDGSRSRQAEIAGQWLGSAFPDLHKAWQQLASEAAIWSGVAWEASGGSVVFPGRMLNDILAETQ